MLNKISYIFIAIGCFGVAGACIVWEEHDQRVHEEQARKVQEEENLVRQRDERLARSAEEACRVLDEIQEPDFWLIDADLWKVKQITVARQLKQTPEQFLKALAEDLQTIVALAPQAGKQARLRWVQAGDVAYALFRLPEAERYYRQAATLADDERDTAESWRLQERLADVWHSAGHFEDERRQREYMATMEQNSGRRRAVPLASAARLAICFRDMGKAAEGLAVMRKVFPSDDWKLEMDRPETLYAATIYVFMLHETHRNAECEAANGHLLGECIRVYGREDARTAIVVGRMVACLIASQKFAEAAQIAPRSIELCQESYGKEHPLMGLFLRFAADAFSGAGDNGTAETLARRSLEIHEAIFSPDNIEIGHDLARLGAIAEKTDRLAEAQRYLRGAEEVYQKCVGPNSDYTLGVQNHLAALQWQTRGSSSAASVAPEAPSSEATSALTGRAAMQALSMQALAASHGGRYQEAEKLLRQAIAIGEKEDPEGLGVAADQVNLGMALEQMGNYVDAEIALNRALEIRVKKLGPQHPDLIPVLGCLAEMYMGTGRATEGERLLLKVVDLGTVNDLTKDLEYARAMNVLASHFQHTNRFEGALALQRRILDNVELALGKDNETYASYLHNLGQSLAFLKRTDEATHALEQAVAIGEKLHPESRLLPFWLSSLGTVYDHVHDTAKADAAYRRAMTLLYRQASETGQTPPLLQGATTVYTNFLKIKGLAQAEIDDRFARLRRGEEVPALPVGK